MRGAGPSGATDCPNTVILQSRLNRPLKFYPLITAICLSKINDYIEHLRSLGVVVELCKDEEAGKFILETRKRR